MSITRPLFRLGHVAERLEEGSLELDALLERIDASLARLRLTSEYLFPRPIMEKVAYDAEGKRAIEVAYVGYMPFDHGFHLAVRTVKILESKKAVATERPGTTVPLLQASLELRHAAVDVLPELVTGLAEQVEDLLDNVRRRRKVANRLVDHLEAVTAESEESGAREASLSAASGSHLSVWRRPE